MKNLRTKPTFADYSLIAVFVLLNALAFFGLDSESKAGSWVIIEVDQKETHRLPLNTEKLIHVQGKLGITDVQIHDKQARILRSPCTGKICIKSGTIKYADRLIACIPNRVVVRIVGNQHRGVDAVVG